MRFVLVLVAVAGLTVALCGTADACRDDQGRYSSCRPPVMGR